MTVDWEALRAAAVAAATRAYAPYSNYRVGAAAIVDDGRFVTGCNVENASYPVGTCAEAGAIAAMVAAGETELVEVAVIADSPEPVPPCGGCRPKLAEFGTGGTPVTLATTEGKQFATTIAELLPGRFDQSHMSHT